MSRRTKIAVCLILAVCLHAYGQPGAYQYRRELKGISEQWHKIALPDDLFGKASESLDDIRIYGITTGHDTIEAPYLLRQASGETTAVNAAFHLLNTSFHDNSYYFTFETPGDRPVNRISLDFRQQNFDWRVRLEGSQDQQEWFTLLDNYRIVSIRHELTDFRFTTLGFPDAKYRYFRIRIDSGSEKPVLLKSGIARNDVSNRVFRNYAAGRPAIKENSRARQTEIGISLPSPVPVSRLRISVRDTFDYYRPVTVQYAADSTRTDEGWKYNYRTLTTGILNSTGDNGLIFNSTRAGRLKILVHNQDNAPLKIDTVRVEGYVHELVARFTEKADYFLVYGNKNATRPQYDITRFSDKIPATLTAIEPGEEELSGESGQAGGPLFRNKAWLWGIMAVIILLLGWFTLRMMRKG